MFLDDVIKADPAIGDIVKIHSDLDNKFYIGKIVHINYKIIYVSYMDFKSIKIIKKKIKNIFALPVEQKKEVGVLFYNK